MATAFWVPMIGVKEARAEAQYELGFLSDSMAVTALIASLGIKVLEQSPKVANFLPSITVVSTLVKCGTGF